MKDATLCEVEQRGSRSGGTCPLRFRAFQPMPDFAYDPDEWLGMVFAFPVRSDSIDLNGIAVISAK